MGRHCQRRAAKNSVHFVYIADQLTKVIRAARRLRDSSTTMFLGVLKCACGYTVRAQMGRVRAQMVRERAQMGRVCAQTGGFQHVSTPKRACGDRARHCRSPPGAFVVGLRFGQGAGKGQTGNVARAPRPSIRSSFQHPSWSGARVCVSSACVV